MFMFLIFILFCRNLTKLCSQRLKLYFRQSMVYVLASTFSGVWQNNKKKSAFLGCILEKNTQTDALTQKIEVKQFLYACFLRLSRTTSMSKKYFKFHLQGRRGQKKPFFQGADFRPIQKKKMKMGWQFFTFLTWLHIVWNFKKF